MTRTLHNCTAIQHKIVGEREFKPSAELKDWMTLQAKHYGLNYLLAHADDGVIWGRFDLKGNLSLSSEHPVQWRLETLQTARLFGDHAEVMLWKADGQNWGARVIGEVEPPEKAPAHVVRFSRAFDEPYTLWGTKVESSEAGFTLMSDGKQGLRHRVPVAVPDKLYSEKMRPLSLQVRHYVAEDKFGAVYIAASRLMTLRISGG